MDPARANETEELILLALARLGPNACGVLVRQEIESRSGEPLLLLMASVLVLMGVTCGNVAVRVVGETGARRPVALDALDSRDVIRSE
jgi:hypothetical protein